MLRLLEMDDHVAAPLTVNGGSEKSMQSMGVLSSFRFRVAPMQSRSTVSSSVNWSTDPASLKQ